MNNYTRNNENRGRGVVDILRLDPNIPEDWEIIDREYNAVDIDKVVIDGDTFTNYGDFQFVWEKSYVKSPSRSNSGAIDNLNSQAYFITPHLIINFSIMSIDDYRAIMRKDLEKNEFTVQCYDPIYNKKITVKMYFATPQMAKLYNINKRRFNGTDWEDFIEIVGVQGYTVELIGTNNDLDLVSVVYHLNPPADTGYADDTLGEPDVYSGEEVVIGQSAGEFVAQTFGGKYKFTKWNITAENPTEPKDHGNYLNGYAYTINRGDEINEGESAFVLYAQWEAITDHTLSFNYGLADPAINESNYTYETSRKVVKGKSIGTLPTAETPKVKYKDLNGVEKTYSPYSNGKWYKTPIKAPNSVAVSNNELYWLNRDSTIYLLYDVIKYDFVLKVLNPETNILETYQENLVSNGNGIEYNTPMNLPYLVRSGYTFDGWYYTSDFKTNTKISGLMPPYSLNLYARWVKE